MSVPANLDSDDQSGAPPAGPARRLLQTLSALFLTRRFATFVVFGGLAAAVNLLVGWVLYTVPPFAHHLPYWLGVGVGAASGLLVNFGLNYAFNFGYFGRSALAQLRTFTVVAAIGVVLTALLAQAVVSIAALFGIEDEHTVGSHRIDVELAAHVIAVGLVTFYSFVAHSAFSFNVGIRRRLSGLLDRKPE